ncbi:hypothetical protein [Paenibacillus sp. FSL K6-0108]|uniref:hypothetical protein n=1 Tax=Paenibacillus sp. FSL K6-0108 TaxID=2921417 RepID=UPI00324C6D13
MRSALFCISLLSIVRNVTVIMQILVFECKFPGGIAIFRQDPLVSERIHEAFDPGRPAMERSSNKTGGWGKGNDVLTAI